jgi:hypothetical protein
MKSTRRYLTLFLILVALLVPTGSAYAQGTGPNDNGRVIFGSNFTLESGETFAGDLVVFGGNVTIEEDAELNGSLVVFGGTVVSDGSVNGDVVIIGGQVELKDASVVSGDVVTIGGQVQRAAGSVVEGELLNNVRPEIQLPSGRVPPGVNVPGVQIPNQINVGFNPFWEFGRVFGSALIVSFLGVLAALFFQERLDRVSDAIVTQPLMSSSIGLLTIVVMIIAAFTLILLPVVGLGLIPLAFAWLFGVISMGQEIGDRFARAVRQDWAPVITTGLGTFVLVFLIASVQSLDNLIPFMGCMTWILPALVGLLAIGAVVVTRFGARPAQGSALTVYVPPTGSPPPPASQA